MKWRKAFEVFNIEYSGRCGHPVKYPVVITTSNGQIQYKMDCKVCGSTGNPMPHKEAIRMGVEIFENRDPSIAKRWRAASRNERWRILYSHYLASPQWFKKREEALARTDDFCTYCGAIANHGHHRFYDRVGDEYQSDLVPLCRACHEQEHARKTPNGRRRD